MIENLTPANPLPAPAQRRCDWLISLATDRDPGRIFCDAPALPGRLRCGTHASESFPLRRARFFAPPLPLCLLGRASRLFGDDP